MFTARYGLGLYIKRSALSVYRFYNHYISFDSVWLSIINLRFGLCVISLVKASRRMQWVKDLVLLYWVVHRSSRLCWSNLPVSSFFSPQRLAAIYRQFRAVPPYFLRIWTVSQKIWIHPHCRQDRVKETIACNFTQNITQELSGNHDLERKCWMFDTPSMTIVNISSNIRKSVYCLHILFMCNMWRLGHAAYMMWKIKIYTRIWFGKPKERGCLKELGEVGTITLKRTLKYRVCKVAYCFCLFQNRNMYRVVLKELGEVGTIIFKY